MSAPLGHLTPPEIDRIAAMWTAGEKIEVIAAEVVCNPATVSFHVKRLGLRARVRGRKRKAA